MKKTTLTRTVTKYESLPYTHLEPGDFVMLIVNREIRPEDTPAGWMNLGCYLEVPEPYEPGEDPLTAEDEQREGTAIRTAYSVLWLVIPVVVVAIEFWL